MQCNDAYFSHHWMSRQRMFNSILPNSPPHTNKRYEKLSRLFGEIQHHAPCSGCSVGSCGVPTQWRNCHSVCSLPRWISSGRRLRSFTAPKERWDQPLEMRFEFDRELGILADKVLSAKIRLQDLLSPRMTAWAKSRKRKVGNGK